MCEIPGIENKVRFYNYSDDIAGYPYFYRLRIVGKRLLNLTNQRSTSRAEGIRKAPGMGRGHALLVDR